MANIITSRAIEKNNRRIPTNHLKWIEVNFWSSSKLYNQYRQFQDLQLEDSTDSPNTHLICAWEKGESRPWNGEREARGWTKEWECKLCKDPFSRERERDLMSVWSVWYGTGRRSGRWRIRQLNTTTFHSRFWQTAFISFFISLLPQYWNYYFTRVKKMVTFKLIILNFFYLE